MRLAITLTVSAQGPVYRTQISLSDNKNSVFYAKVESFFTILALSLSEI